MDEPVLARSRLALSALFGAAVHPVLDALLREFGASASFRLVGLKAMALAALLGIAGVWAGVTAASGLELYRLRSKGFTGSARRIATFRDLGILFGLPVAIGLSFGAGVPPWLALLVGPGFLAALGVARGARRKDPAPQPVRRPLVSSLLLAIVVLLQFRAELGAFPRRGTPEQRQAWALQNLGEEYPRLLQALSASAAVRDQVGAIQSVAPTADDPHWEWTDPSGPRLHVTLEVIGEKGQGKLRVLGPDRAFWAWLAGQQVVALQNDGGRIARESELYLKWDRAYQDWDRNARWPF